MYSLGWFAIPSTDLKCGSSDRLINERETSLEIVSRHDLVLQWHPQQLNSPGVYQSGHITHFMTSWKGPRSRNSRHCHTWPATCGKQLATFRRTKGDFINKTLGLSIKPGLYPKPDIAFWEFKSPLRHQWQQLSLSTFLWFRKDAVHRRPSNRDNRWQKTTECRQRSSSLQLHDPGPLRTRTTRSRACSSQPRTARISLLRPRSRL